MIRSRKDSSQFIRVLVGTIWFFSYGQGWVPVLTYAEEVKPVSSTTQNSFEESHPNSSLEPMYLQAVLAFHGKRNIEVLQVLDQLLKIEPKHIQALELKALTLKSKGDKKRSIQVYEELLQIQPKEERGPYHFELGILYYSAKNFPMAKTHLEEAIQHQFNVPSSHFYLGLMYFSEGQSEVAEWHFSESLDAPKEWQMASYYYLGIIQSTEGFDGEALRDMYEAFYIASSLPKSGFSEQIIKGTEPFLAPYRSGQWFGNLSLLAQYDGNASLLPNSATSPDLVSKKATAKSIYILNLGRSSAAASLMQWVLNYRGAYNSNFNSEASSAQFLTHMLDLYLIRKALGQTSLGVKMEGVYNFQKTSSGFQGYSITSEIGPFIRQAVGKKSFLTGEFLARPLSYLVVQDLSGLALMARASYKQDQQEGGWNPQLIFSLEKNRAQGALFRYFSISGNFSNAIYLTDSQILNVSTSVSLLSYAEASPARSDTNLWLRAGWLKTLSQHLTLSVDGNLQMNQSNYDQFTYTQPIFSLGLSYLL